MRAEFDESLVTGNEMIDSQHKELIDKINKLLDSCETSKDKVVSVKNTGLSRRLHRIPFWRRRKNCRKRLHIRVWKSTKKSMKKFKTGRKRSLQYAGRGRRAVCCICRSSE
mgnify:CR=1 FL=1